MANIKELGEDQIKAKIAWNWLETKDAFIADNLLIYFREEFKEWRLKDTSYPSTMDITTIKIPLDIAEISRVRQLCSSHHKIR